MSGSFYQMFVTLRNGESMNLRNIYINKYVKMCRGGVKRRELLSQLILLYTLLFIGMSLMVFSWYFFAKRTFIWQSDGWSQHYKALFYYAKYLRSIIKTLFVERRLSVPSWDFSLGEGNDILQTLHYYVIGDPFTVMSVLIPVRFMYLYYNAIVLLRLYISGIAFICLCLQTGRTGRYAVLAGAMAYAFCCWAVFNAARHPYFLNPMVYFPLLITGIEKILRKERPYLFIVMVFLCAVSNFYFFYMIVLLTVMYVVVRVLLLYRSSIRRMLKIVLKIAIAAMIGVLLAAVILLPVCYTFLNDTRMSVRHPLHLFYPLSHYCQLPGLFVAEGASYWCWMGFAVPVLPAVLLMFQKRGRYRLLKCLFLLDILIILIPALGQILNGFSYMSNRWSWAFALLTAYILTAMWPSMMKLEAGETVTLFTGMVAYFAVCMLLERSRMTKVFTSIILAFIFLFLLITLKDGEELISRKRRQQLAMAVVLASVFINSFWRNSSSGDNYASESKEIKDLADNELLTNETLAVMDAAASDRMDSFYRYSGRGLTLNAGMIAGVSSTQYFWSISNPYVCNFREITEQIENVSFSYRGYDDRTALLSLASVLYYVMPEKDSAPLPYGFAPVGTINVKDEDAPLNYKVYRNENALPLGYTYENCISAAEWNTLSAVEKQEALLQAVVLEDYEAAAGPLPDLTALDMRYTVTCNGDNITLEENAFVVTSGKATATLTFEGLPNSETYFSVENLSFQGVPVYDLYFGGEDVDPADLYDQERWDSLSHTEKKSIWKNKIYWTAPVSADLSIKSSAGVAKTLSYHTADHAFYSGRHDFTVNMDYTEEAVTSVTITFPHVGIYSFDSMNITCQPMDRYVGQIEERKEDVLENIKIGTNCVSGTIELDQAKFLCLAIPYSEGWNARVDGQESTLYQANIMYMALALEPGTHTIELFYETPLLKEGIDISMVTALVFFFYVAFWERKRRKGRK